MVVKIENFGMFSTKKDDPIRQEILNTGVEIKPFKKSQRVTLIKNNKYIHLFKIIFLDNSTAVFDNNFNYVMSSKIVKKNREG